MISKTQINEEMSNGSSATVINEGTKKGGNVTVVNSEIINSNSTVVNGALMPSTELSVGSVLCNKYVVESKMDVVNGEADLYICDYNGEKFVAKIYRRAVSLKEEVMNKLKEISSPYVAKLHETGMLNDRLFEITPYYSQGSLESRTFSYEELMDNIIPKLNEGLRALHQDGILHKDLKPANVMLCDNGKDVILIDFGISSVMADGSTVLVTQTGMTQEYAAPESFKQLYLEESDYYSLGITIYELFCGKTPYRNLTGDAIEQYIIAQRIPFPSDMPERLKNLITGLTYNDITNRRNKENPNRRWTYDEVKRFVNSEDLPIPGEGAGVVASKAMPAYSFMNKQITNIPELVREFTLNWEEGKKQLFRGILSGFFKSFDPQIAGYCMDAEDQGGRSKDQDDIILFKLLYKIDQENESFHWKDRIYEDLKQFGENLFNSLREEKVNYTYWDSVLSNKILTEYFIAIDFKGDDQIDVVSGFENLFKKAKLNAKQKMYYMLANALTGKKSLYMNDQIFDSFEQLFKYMKELLSESHEKFDVFCSKLINKNDALDAQFEAWLIAQGKNEEIKTWKEKLINQSRV